MTEWQSVLFVSKNECFWQETFLSSFFDSRDNSFWELSHVVTQVIDIAEGGGCPRNMFNKTKNRTLLWEQQRGRCGVWGITIYTKEVWCISNGAQGCGEKGFYNWRDFKKGHGKTQSLPLTIRWNYLIGLVDNAWDTCTSRCFSSMSPCSLIF